jgi:hypothetical protein
MALNVVAGRPIIKHVFEACRNLWIRDLRPTGFVGGLPYRFATVRSHVLLIEHMID